MSFLKKLFLTLNILAALGLCLSYLASTVSPLSFWLLAFFGMGYPAFFLINILFVLFWLLRLKIYCLISLMLILLGFGEFNKLVAVLWKDDNELIRENAMKIISYNVQNFGLYNWKNNVEYRDKMLSLMEEEHPQIVCFQEFYTDEEGIFENIDRIRRQLQTSGYHFEKVFSKDQHHWGIATFTSYPIVSSGRIDLDNSLRNIAMYTDIKVGEQVIRVYNLHLQSIHFQPEDYQYLEKVKEKKKPDINSSKKILSKLKYAFIKRAVQAEIIAEHIKNCSLPVIVCGDFNDMPVSYAYQTIANGLQDAFVEAGTGLGITYAGFLPAFRIDYILFHKTLSAQDYFTIKKKYSDHYPIVCVLRLE